MCSQTYQRFLHENSRQTESSRHLASQRDRLFQWQLSVQVVESVEQRLHALLGRLTVGAFETITGAAGDFARDRRPSRERDYSGLTRL